MIPPTALDRRVALGASVTTTPSSCTHGIPGPLPNLVALLICSSTLTSLSHIRKVFHLGWVRPSGQRYRCAV